MQNQNLVSECMAGSNQCVDGTAPTTTETTKAPDATSPPEGEHWKLTTIYMKIETQLGQDAFLRGGVPESEGYSKLLVDSSFH